jgi:uncharacterized protein YndB with AHSA1/START domain
MAAAPSPDQRKKSMLDHVIYPPEYDPRISPIYALNEIDVKAPPEAVWKLLVEAENWASYFPPEDQVKLPDGVKELTLGTHYTRMTIGYKMFPIVTECVPFRRLSWTTSVEGDETGSTAFHGWVITPTDEGCHVLSEETQQGPWFVEMLAHRYPGKLFEYHQDWVEGLARAAEAQVLANG